MREKIKFSSILRNLIEDKRVSIREVSRACSIPQSTLRSYLRGTSSHKAEHLVCLADYFGTSVDFLLSGRSQKSPTLDEVLTDPVFDGWLRVKIERALPNRRKGEDQ